MEIVTRCHSAHRRLQKCQLVFRGILAEVIQSFQEDLCMDEGAQRGVVVVSLSVSAILRGFHARLLQSSKAQNKYGIYDNKQL